MTPDERSKKLDKLRRGVGGAPLSFWMENLSRRNDNAKRIVENLSKSASQSLAKKDTIMGFYTPLNKLKRIPNPRMRYKAILLGDPTVIPEDIEWYVSEELERIAKESLLP